MPDVIYIFPRYEHLPAVARSIFPAHARLRFFAFDHVIQFVLFFLPFIIKIYGFEGCLKILKQFTERERERESERERERGGGGRWRVKDRQRAKLYSRSLLFRSKSRPPREY